ncbi:MAG: adenylate/guanylate cyclase domain-containing protein [Candidatus Riflebacteria bacterium]|nr:adenylate/guanylate cyclase domain-containing protein [Candidatus Riflebacteria bacterium]
MLKVIKPEKPAPFRLFIFWLIVFVVPIISSKLLINAYVSEKARENDLQNRETLRREMDLFIADLDLANMIETNINQVEQRLQYEISNSLTRQNPAEVCLLADRLFKETTIYQPVLIAVYSSQSKKAEVLRLDPGYINPGRKSVEIILSYLKNSAEGKASEAQTRLYQQICGSTFGDLLQPAEQAGILTSGFLAKGRGDHLFIYYNHLKSGKDKARNLVFMLMFAEAKTDFRRQLGWARQNNENPSLKRGYALLRTLADRDYVLDEQKRLHYIAPIPPTVLRTGSHAGKDWYTKAIRSGLARRKPSRLPYAVVSLKIDRQSTETFSTLDLVNLALLAAFFIGTALMRRIITERFTKAPINRKFAVSIFLATTLPFTGLIISAHKFIGHFNQTLVQNRLRSMSNELYTIESNIQNYEFRRQKQTTAFVDKINENVHKPAINIREMLDSHFGDLYAGYVMLRNDATLIEKLPEMTEIDSNDRKKLQLMRDLILAQTHNVFLHAGTLTADFEKNAARIPDFRRWHAYSSHYEPIDRNSFCMQDGNYYPTKISDRQYIRFSTHNLFPKDGDGKYWACLMLLTDSKETTEKYLDTMPGQLFISLNQDSITHTAIYRYQDNARKHIDREKAWPHSAIRDKQMLHTADSLGSGKSEASWFSTDKTGIIDLFCARAVSDMPFVITSRAELYTPALLSNFLPVMLLIAVIYLLLLIKLLSSALTEAFLRPVNMMLQGLEALDSGSYPTIADSSTNELGYLINDFNGMVEGMRQRKILERFISEEVSQSIARQGSDQQVPQGQLVYRTVMFIHIRKFDEICEKIEPESVIKLLNIYFSSLESVIIEHGGQIDKYIGDAIMVSFANERTNGQPEIAASKTALSCKNLLPVLNKKLQTSGLPLIIIGTGIAAGQVILGQIGAQDGRKDFTLIGDAVNLAARLESASHYDAIPQILVSRAIEKKASRVLQFKSHGQINIKGKQSAIEVFELETTKL